MKKYYRILSLFIILVYVSGFGFSQTLKESMVNSEKKIFASQMKLSKILYPGDSTIDVTYYKLDLAIATSPNYLKGIVTVNANSSSQGLKTFFLDLKNQLSVDSVYSNGNKLSSVSHSNNKLFITLDTTYNTGASFSVIIYYEGLPVVGGFGGFQFNTHNGGKSPSIWSLSESYQSSNWWPCKDTPADKADSSDVWITCSDSLIGASNGLLQAVTENGNGTHTYKWKNSYPIAQYLISVAISNYTVYTNYYKYSVSDSMPIINYVFPEQFNASKSAIDKVPNMIKIYSNYYGQYPFLREKYGHAQFTWGGGMEHQTITSLLEFDEDLEAHELAHQWFGDKVTCATWQDIWLNEGFATFSEAIYFGASQNQTVYSQMIIDDMNTAKNAQGPIYVQDISSENSIFDYSRTYAKGAVVLHMLREITGDSTFFNILKTYNSTNEFGYKSATTADFEHVAEQVSGQNLSYFFNEWIHGENYPQYTVTWNYHSAGNNNYDVVVNVNQATNTNPLYFTMPIQIKITTVSGDTTITVFNNQQNQQFDIMVSNSPRYITFDPNNYILKSLILTDTIDLTKPSTFTLLQNYPNPFNPATSIEYTIPVQSKGYIPVKLVVYDVLGRQVAVLVNQRQSAGSYKINFPSAGLSKTLPSGIYIYSLTAGNFRSVKKMALLK
jgi:aminopeptidase N